MGNNIRPYGFLFIQPSGFGLAYQLSVSLATFSYVSLPSFHFVSQFLFKSALFKSSQAVSVRVMICSPVIRAPDSGHEKVRYSGDPKSDHSKTGLI